MAIYSPDIQLSDNDKIILNTISSILEPIAKHGREIPKNTIVEIPLTDAEQLLGSLNRTIRDRSLIEKTEFVERLKGSPVGSKGLSQIIFERETKNGAVSQQ